MALPRLRAIHHGHGLMGRLHEARRRWPRWLRALTVKPVVIVVAILVALVASYLAYAASTRSPTHFLLGGKWFGAGAPRTTSSPAPSPRNVWATLPRQGTYLFAASGHEGASIGFLSICGWSVGPYVPIDVHGMRPVRGGHQVVIDWDLNSDHDKVRYVWYMNPRGSGVVFVGAEVTCGGIERSDDTTYTRYVPRFRFPLRVGASWQGVATSALRTERFKTRVVAARKMTLAGRTWSTWEIENNIAISGDQKGTRTETWWYAPALGMAVKMHFHTSANQSGATFTSDYTLRLQHVPG